ncbi:sulfotransferase [Roseovarius sp. CAU 1744]|uniref:sulfotransferase n=1 Tax=Roseovarius sp. CAU 1744 TaxID=3140368 RepID=UPI00325B2DE2
MTAKRTATFQRNHNLEALLGRLNHAISEARLPASEAPALPTLFILGTPRSGTTYCMQWLAASGAFSYPSNLIARFWQAPAIGAMCQEMLANPEYDFRGEFSDIGFHDPQQRSDLGKTTGLLSPNEFWYFWRSSFPGDGDIGIDLTRAEDMQFQLFAEKLAAFAEVRGKPVATKGMIVNHQLAKFASAIPNALFLHLDRDPVASAWSMLRAREKMHGDRQIWYSFRTPNYEALRHLPPAQQVMGQIDKIRRDLIAQLSELPQDRWVSLDYAQLCTEPDAAFDTIRSLFAAKGVALEGRNTLPSVAMSQPDIPKDVRAEFDAYLSR